MSPITARLTFLGVERVSKRRMAFSSLRLMVRVIHFYASWVHAIVKGVAFFFLTLGEELVDHFNNRKYPR